MELIVTRTSSYGDKQPCEEAYRSEKSIVDTRTLKTFRAFEKKFGESFLAKGTNHEETPDGFITRRLGTRSCWRVTIKDLEELSKFSEKYGSIIFDGVGIEIYDNYRE